jgi:formylmethanofuran dehydrogenase subunit E
VIILNESIGTKIANCVSKEHNIKDTIWVNEITTLAEEIDSLINNNKKEIISTAFEKLFFQIKDMKNKNESLNVNGVLIIILENIMELNNVERYPIKKINKTKNKLKVCKGCGEKFIRTNEHKFYCSDICRLNYLINKEDDYY